MKHTSLTQIEAAVKSLSHLIEEETFTQEEMEYIWALLKNLELVLRSNTEGRAVESTETVVYTTSKQVRQQLCYPTNEHKSACKMAVDHTRSKLDLLHEVVETYGEK